MGMGDHGSGDGQRLFSLRKIGPSVCQECMKNIGLSQDKFKCPGLSCCIDATYPDRCHMKDKEYEDVLQFYK